MEQREIDRYNILIGSENARYKLQTVDGRVVLGIKKGLDTKVGMLVMGKELDFLAMGDDLTGLFGTGFNVNGRLCEADEEELKRVIELAKRGIFYGNAEKEKRAAVTVERDVLSLRDLERGLYGAGFELPENQAVLELF